MLSHYKGMCVVWAGLCVWLMCLVYVFGLCVWFIYGLCLVYVWFYEDLGMHFFPQKCSFVRFFQNEFNLYRIKVLYS